MTWQVNCDSLTVRYDDCTNRRTTENPSIITVAMKPVPLTDNTMITGHHGAHAMLHTVRQLSIIGFEDGTNVYMSCNRMSALVAPSGECLRSEGLVWLIGAVVCSLAAYRGSNCSLARAMDDRI